MTVLASVRDQKGRVVELTAERWAHVLERHPELATEQQSVLDAVTKPVREHPGRRPNERWLYVEGSGPSRLLKVVVAYEGARGWVVTALPRRRFP
jgi:hypothetical protein